MECWTTLADLTSLQQWEQRFGPGFVAAIVFVYWCEGEPPGALYQDVFEFRKRWYALRAVRVQQYVSCMRVRSPKWGTVDLAPSDFARISQPFAPGSHFPLRRGASVDVGAGLLGRASEGNLPRESRSIRGERARCECVVKLPVAKRQRVGQPRCVAAAQAV
jgi:hypothetical protein